MTLGALGRIQQFAEEARGGLQDILPVDDKGVPPFMGTDKGPFETLVRPKATVICGDFILEYASDLLARMVAPFDDGTPALADAWDVLNPGQPYPATFCIHNVMPGYGQLHCDFFFVDPEARARLAGWQIDQQTQASDHQPVILTLR